MNTKIVHVAGVIYATIFGFTFMFSKVALEHVRPIGLIAYRFLIAFICLEILRQFKVFKISINKSNFLPLFWVALFQPVLYFLFETFGILKTTSGEAGMMIALIPIFVTILSAIIMKEKPRLIQFLFIILSVSGVLFIQIMKSNSGVSLAFAGLMLLLGAVISAALFNIASRSASKKVKPHELTYFMMLFGSIVFNIMYITQLAIEDSITRYVTNLYHIELLLPILYLGIVASIGGFFLVNFALSRVPAHVSSIYANLSTIVAIVAGALILNEKLYYYHFLGGFMIITGVYGTVRFNRLLDKRIK
ncbi:MAG: EamA/RhaT family transporter [Bacillota bacterium]|nr:MAG: EamA/RhaT family transporter [Bacillota bacterium]